MRPSHRQTTSSRTPGRINHGTVQVRASGFATCPDCGAKCNASVPKGKHAPHLALIEGRLGLVNCVNRVLP